MRCADSLHGGNAAVDAARAVARGDFGVAAVRYRALAIADPGDPVPPLLAATASLAAKRPADALPMLARVRRIFEGDVAHALLEQAALSDLGDAARSQQVWLDLVRRHGRADGTIKADASLQRLKAARHRFAGSALLEALLADTAQASGEWSTAKGAYRRAIAQAPSWVKPRVNYGIGLLAHGEASEAIRVLEEGLRTEPADPKARLAYADAQMVVNRPEGALRDYQKLALDPKWSASAKLGVGRAQLALGRPDEARKSFIEARKASPSDPAPMIAIGEMYLRTSEPRAAADSFASALRVAEAGGVVSARASLLRLLIEARIAASDLVGAGQAISEARAKEPGESSLWWRLESQVLRSRRDYPAAEEALRAALESDGSPYPLETLRAIDDAGWTRKFVATYRTALEGFRTGVQGSARDGRIVLISVPRSKAGEIRCLAVLGHLHRLLGEPGEEVSVRRDLCRLRGNGCDWFLLGEAFERVGRLPDARAAFREALVLGDLPAGAKATATRRLER
ncbi:MAG: tetratricopeptide repeat protein [Armatimonadota bacterium]